MNCNWYLFFSELNQMQQSFSIVLKTFLSEVIDLPLRAFACSLEDDCYSNGKVFCHVR